MDSVQLSIDHEENSSVVFSVISNYLKRGLYMQIHIR